MKFIKGLSLNQNSQICAWGLLSAILILFVVSSVSFLWLLADKIDLVLSQSPATTFNFFIMIMNRVLIFLILFFIIPVVLFQVFSKDKSSADRTFSYAAVSVLFAFVCLLLTSGYYFFKSYEQGKLAESKMFHPDEIEFRLFDSVINKPEVK